MSDDPDEGRCVAATRSGRRCRNGRAPGSLVCWRHAEAGTSVARRQVRVDEDHERAQRALLLRRAGASWSIVADREGYSSTSTACRAVRRLLEANAPTPDDLDAERQLQVERLDGLLLRWWTKAIGDGGADPDGDAADRVLRIIEAQAKMLGLHRPAKVELSGRVDIAALSPIERREMLAAAVREAVRREAVDVDDIVGALPAGD